MKLDKKKMQIAMARKKMSNASLARATGITPQTVGNMLRGCCDTSLPTVGKVAEALDVDVTDIIADQKHAGGHGMSERRKNEYGQMQRKRY